MSVARLLYALMRRSLIVILAAGGYGFEVYSGKDFGIRRAFDFTGAAIAGGFAGGYGFATGVGRSVGGSAAGVADGISGNIGAAFGK